MTYATANWTSFSALQRAEIAEMPAPVLADAPELHVSVLFNEPKLLKLSVRNWRVTIVPWGFSALQRAEIAEMATATATESQSASRFSALQRAEIAEIAA